MKPSFFSFWHRLDSVARARFWLGVALFCLALIILFGGKPWTVDIPEGERPKIRDFVHLWFWPAAVVNFLAVAVLAWLAPLWVGKARSVPGNLAERKPSPWFWPMLGLAAVFLLVTALPRMGQSVWHDEANRVKNETVGRYKVQPDGTAEFRPTPWLHTLFYCTMPNHVLQTSLSRASHDVWELVARPSGYPLSEAALRVPILIAGIAGVMFVGVLLRGLGLPGAGVLGAWLLAVHPWYLRYASEARSYAFAMALVPALLYFLLRALETDRTKWWVAYGLSQWAMVYAYVTAVHVLVVLNLLAIPLMFALTKRSLDLRVVWKKWLVANILSGILFVQLYSPCVPQMLHYLHTAKAAGSGWTLDYFWMTNFLAHLISGLPWTYIKAYPADHLELMSWAILHPVAFVAICFVAIGALVLGLAAMVKRGAFETVTAVVFILPAVTAFVHAKVEGSYLFEWYLIFLLPGACALVAVGLTSLFPSSQSRAIRWAAVGSAILLVVLFAIWTQPLRFVLMQRSIQPYRESVLLTRPSLDPNYPGQEDIITSAFGSRPLVYDPRVRVIRSMEEVRGLMDEADTQKKKLFFNIAYPETSRMAHPDLYEYIEKSGRFRRVRELQGLYQELDMDVHVYLGNPANPARVETPEIKN